MKRFYFEKLVRDGVVDGCLDDPNVPHTEWRALGDDEYRQELLRKMREEVDEVIAARDGAELVEELADLQEVMNALRAVAGATEQDIRRAATKKNEKKGSFDGRRYIEYVDLTDDSDWVEKLRRQPDKYREVNIDRTEP